MVLLLFISQYKQGRLTHRRANILRINVQRGGTKMNKYIHNTGGNFCDTVIRYVALKIPLKCLGFGAHLGKTVNSIYIYAYIHVCYIKHI